jgi:hypothetical protein
LLRPFADIHQPVIASAAKQSRVVCGTLDCVAALAMTSLRQQRILPAAVAAADQPSVVAAAPPL